MTSSAVPRINSGRISKFAAFAREANIGAPLNFYSVELPNGTKLILEDMYPPLHAPWVIDFFFLAIAHQYGFWHGEVRYQGPLYGTLQGKKLKGSDLLWKLILRGFTKDASALTGGALAQMTRERWEALMSDDNGPIPLLVTEERLALTRGLGTSLLRHGAPLNTARGWVRHHLALKMPATQMLESLAHPKFGIIGYREDPLQKKALLLLMALANRPEKMLVPESQFTWNPIVDYHVMRLVLRLGLVTLPKTWRNKNASRAFTTVEREAVIRQACAAANKEVILRSGRSMAEIDALLWDARRYCPEMETPNCGECALRSVCQQRTELFQPVIRTTTY